MDKFLETLILPSLNNRNRNFERMRISKEIESKIKPSITKNQMASLRNPTKHLMKNQNQQASHSAKKTDKKGKVPNSFGKANTAIT